MNQLEKFASINTFLFDVDGVLTNSDLVVTEEGDLLRKMSTRDGYAIKKAVREGFRVVVITGGSSKGVSIRLKALGVDPIYVGIQTKSVAFEDFLAKFPIPKDRILYMGDDLPDYSVMAQIGLACCPADAVPEIKDISDYISPFKGGEGCVRDVIEKVLKLNQCWFTPEQKQLLK